MLIGSWFPFGGLGWNVVLVLDGTDSDAVLTKYTWGLDLSQSLHGAGGVGGLLAAVETQGTSSTADDDSYWFLYDGTLDASPRSKEKKRNYESRVSR